MRFRLLTALTAVSTWALVAVGGVVRVTESGLGCPHWPLCTAGAVPLDRRASVIEYSHRAVVALVVVLVTAVAVAAWRRRRERPDLVGPAFFALGLVPLQALLGAIAIRLELPGWVVAFHFLEPPWVSWRLVYLHDTLPPRPACAPPLSAGWPASTGAKRPCCSL